MLYVIDYSLKAILEELLINRLNGIIDSDFCGKTWSYIKDSVEFLAENRYIWQFI